MLTPGQTLAVAVLVLVPVIGTPLASAQSSSTSDRDIPRVTGTFAYGASTAPGGQGLVRFDVDTGYGQVSGRWFFSRERLFTVFGALPNERNTDVGLQYGFVSEIAGPVSLSLSAGVSFLTVVRRGRVESAGFLRPTRHEKLVERYAGIPFDIQLRVGQPDRIRLMVGIAGTFAGTESFGGPVFGFSLPGNY